MKTAEEVLESSVHKLPKLERLRLAALILQELAFAEKDALAYSDGWTEEDIRDLNAHSLRCASDEQGDSELA